MTIEQKFKQLLDIACKNGFDKEFLEVVNEKGIQIFGNSYYINNQYNSLNDLVLQTNFFDCLFKDLEVECQNEYDMGELYYIIYNPKKGSKQTKYKATLSKTDFLKQIWMLELKNGTALEWLFKQFSL